VRDTWKGETTVIEALGSALVVIADLLAVAGALFFLISAVGLLRLPDFYCRIHAPTKAATLGVFLLGLSGVLRSLVQGDLVWTEDLAILLFLFLTIPVSSQVLARAARRSGVEEVRPTSPKSPNRP
jgi:multicomponent K+:H+ antiporter subunit G